nr:RNA-dependent RNA polymerase [Flumine narna-like virus 37]
MEDEELMEGLRTTEPLVSIKQLPINHEKLFTTEIVFENGKWEVKMEMNENEYEYDDSELQRRYEILYDRICDKAATEEPLVEPVALAEALKIRVITKGPWARSVMMKPLQHFMWSTIKSNPCFKLIGEPVTDIHVQDRLGSKLTGDDKFLSGDYAAATNKLASWASEQCATSIAKIINLTSIEEKVFLTSLTGHIIKYKNSNGEDVFVDQRNGQLMGSITSFPILCIINAALCRAALEYANGRNVILLRDCPLMINGDDVGMKINGMGYKYWSALTNAAGLIESVGKCFYTEQFININSTNFIYTEQPRVVRCLKSKPAFEGEMVDREIHFELVPYVNMGLVKGVSRSSSISNSDADDLSTSLGQCYREMLHFAPKSLHSQLHYSFIQHNKAKLAKFHVPWHVPEWLGGLGLYGFKEPSKLDLRIVNKILMERKVPEIFAITDAPVFQVHKFVMGRMPTRITRHVSDAGLLNYRKFYGSLCVETLFRQSFSQIFTPKDKTANNPVLRRLRSNERLWKNLLQKGNLPPPVKFSPSGEPGTPGYYAGIIPQSVFSYINISRLSIPNSNPLSTLPYYHSEFIYDDFVFGGVNY